MCYHVYRPKSAQRLVVLALFSVIIWTMQSGRASKIEKGEHERTRVYNTYLWRPLSEILRHCWLVHGTTEAPSPL